MSQCPSCGGDCGRTVKSGCMYDIPVERKSRETLLQVQAAEIERQASLIDSDVAVMNETIQIQSGLIEKLQEEAQKERIKRKVAEGMLKGQKCEIEHQPAAVPDDGMRKAAEFLRIERDEYRRQRDIAVAALEQYVTEEGATMLAREALKEIGEIK